MAPPMSLWGSWHTQATCIYVSFTKETTGLEASLRGEPGAGGGGRVQMAWLGLQRGGLASPHTFLISLLGPVVGEEPFQQRVLIPCRLQSLLLQQPQEPTGLIRAGQGTHLQRRSQPHISPELCLLPTCWARGDRQHCRAESPPERERGAESGYVPVLAPALRESGTHSPGPVRASGNASL